MVEANQTINFNDSGSSAQFAWSKTFPMSMANTKDSLNFVKRVVYMAIPTIFGKRGLLHKSALKVRQIERYKAIVPNTADPIGERLHKKLNGISKCIEDGFLEEIGLVFYRAPNEDDVIEIYSFSFHYDEEGVNLKFESRLTSDHKLLSSVKYESLEKAQEDTFHLFHFISILSKSVMKPLPSDADCSIRLSYRPHTPRGYQTAGFESSDDFYEPISNREAVAIGSVVGGHHGTFLQCQSALFTDVVRADDLRASIKKSLNMTLNNSIDQSFTEAIKPYARTHKLRQGSSKRQVPL